MNRDLLLRFVFALPLCWVLCLAQAFAQTALVKGTVSASTVPVRNASVTFENQNNAAQTYVALTDSAGRYQLSVELASAGPGPNLPSSFALEQNYPNPFSSSTVVPYELTTQSDIQVTIYDILGRVVRRISAGTQPAGAHSVLWDGRDASGHKVASGIYLYSLRVGGEVLAKKMVMNGGGNGYVPLPRQHSAPPATLNRTADLALAAGTYTVRVENYATTFPLIVSKQISNVVILGDTTIDLPVDTLAIPASTVYLDSLQQYIRGFGAANILPWRPDMTADQVQTGFGTGQGQLGFTILRLRVPYTDTVTDFSAQVPTAKLAESLGAIVFATPWTPPPAMKSNNNIAGGTLNEASYPAYAAHLKGFADYMAANGAPLYAISLQNEPDANVTYESCFWNATQFLNFTKNNAAAVGARIIMPESENFNHALSDPTLNDPAAAANVAIIGGHLYGGGLAPYPLAVAKGKEVWMTEYLDLDTTWAGTGNNYLTGVLATGKQMHDCMNAGMNAYVTWYIVRFYGPIGEDGRVTERGYVMSQFSRFIRPGFHKVKCNPTPQRNVYLTSYTDSASSRVVIVALNMGASSVRQVFSIPEGSMLSFAVYTTSKTRNCARAADISFVRGGFIATLDPSSITTFVSN